MYDLKLGDLFSADEIQKCIGIIRINCVQSNDTVKDIRLSMINFGIVMGFLMVPFLQIQMSFSSNGTTFKFVHLQRKMHSP